MSGDVSLVGAADSLAMNSLPVAKRPILNRGPGRAVCLLLPLLVAHFFSGGSCLSQVSGLDQQQEDVGPRKLGMVGEADSTTTSSPQESARVDRLKRRLSSEDLQARRRAAINARDLQLNEQRQLLDEFIRLLSDEKDGQVRLAVLAVVTDMGPAASEAVDALVQAIRFEHASKYDEETHQDYRAALALAAIGKPSVGPLRELTTESKVNRRADAAMALGRIGPAAADAISDLTKLLRDDDAWVRREASQAIGMMGQAALSPLLLEAGDPDPNVRASVIATIGLIAVPSERRTAAVLSALDSDDEAVEAAAIGSLNSLDLPSGTWTSLVLNGLRSDHPSARLAAINASLQHVGRIGGMREPLVELLDDSRIGVVQHAAFLLHKLGPSVIAEMLESLTIDDPAIEVIGNAIAMIGPRGVSELQETLRISPPASQEAAAIALGKIRPVSPDTVRALAAALESEDPGLREASLNAFMSLGKSGRNAVPTVLGRLDDRSAKIRSKTIVVLFEIAPRDSALVAQLIPMVRDRDATVQRQAIETLRSIGPVGRVALPAAIDQLSSDAASVRESAAVFVGSHGRAAADAVPSLTPLLSDSDDSFRLIIVATLGKLGSAARPAQQPLTDMLDDSNVAIRLAALDAIGKLGIDVSELLPLLRKSLGDDDQQVRDAAMRIMRRLGEDAIVLVPDLIPLAAVETQRRSVSRVLERLQRFEIDRAVLDLLGDLLSHEDAEVRLLAIRVLGRSGKRAADFLPRIESLREDPNEDVREEVNAAIAAISGGAAD